MPHRASRLPLVLAAALLLASPELAAQPEFERELTTDRPDVAESAWTVGTYRLQLETGVELQTDTVQGVDLLWLTLPTKLRFGVVEAIEIHLETDMFVWERRSATRSDLRGADLDFGFKIHAIDGEGWVPATALLVSITAPVGDDRVSANAWLVSPTFALEWDLPLELGLAVNLGFTAPLTERERTDDVVRYALALGRSLTPVADWLGVFVQVFGETTLDGDETEAGAGGGFTFLVHEQVQLDIYANAGLTDSSPAFTGGAGLAFRL